MRRLHSLLIAVPIVLLLTTFVWLGTVSRQPNQALQHVRRARGLKGDYYGQFEPLADTNNVYGSWGGSWLMTKPPDAAAPQAGPTRGGLVGSRANGVRRTTALPRRAANATSVGAARGSGGVAGSSGKSGGSQGAVASPNGVRGAVPASIGISSIARRPVIPSTWSSVGDGRKVVSSRMVVVPGRRFDPATGAFTTAAISDGASTGAGGSGGSAAAGGTNSTGSAAAGGASNGTSTGGPPGTNTTVLGADPVESVNVPANAFEAGYCVPRRAYLVVNVTARACNPGSNLTTWDGEPVCARLDCSFRDRGTNVMVAPSACRTVVERPRPICPPGCDVIQQSLFNATANRTQVFNKCSCRAGNQRCPARWTGCICYPRPSVQNVTSAYVVCSEAQVECNRKCNLAVPGSLAPLCPIQLDPLLSTSPISGPTYPLYGWNLAAQGQATAAVAAVGGRLRRLLHWWQRGAAAV